MPNEGCIDADNGATDIYGDGCIYYNGNPGDCGRDDDNDFFANAMCCACGGGKKGIMSDILYGISYLLGNGKWARNFTNNKMSNFCNMTCCN